MLFLKPEQPGLIPTSHIVLWVPYKHCVYAHKVINEMKILKGNEKEGKGRHNLRPPKDQRWGKGRFPVAYVCMKISMMKNEKKKGREEGRVESSLQAPKCKILLAATGRS